MSPLRLRAANPLPRGFMPKIGKGWLYPDEDRKLLASPAVPLTWRVVSGFLDREGPRHADADGSAGSAANVGEVRSF